MKISFLITYYNQEQYVRQSMDSILAIEKPEEWEILVGDDGSTDGTVDIVNEYIRRDPEHIKLYVMPREAGKKYLPLKRASANRLNILEHCSGDCFCILDGDDFYIDTKFVLEAIDVLEKHNDVSVVLFGQKYFRDGKFEKDRLLPAGVEQRVDKKFYILNCCINTGAGVHKLQWEKNRIEYIKKLGIFDDDSITMNSLNYGNMYYINRSIHAYRQLDGSMIHSIQPIEVALYNTVTCDVEKLMMDQGDWLIERHRWPILTAFMRRNRLQKILGDSKYNQWVECSKNIDNAISYKLLIYKSLDKSEKREIKKLVLQIFLQGVRRKLRKWFSKKQKYA